MDIEARKGVSHAMKSELFSNARFGLRSQIALTENLTIDLKLQKY
jgi:hypothetical protein